MPLRKLTLPLASGLLALIATAALVPASAGASPYPIQVTTTRDSEPSEGGLLCEAGTDCTLRAALLAATPSRSAR